MIGYPFCSVAERQSELNNDVTRRSYISIPRPSRSSDMPKRQFQRLATFTDSRVHHLCLVVPLPNDDFLPRGETSRLKLDEALPAAIVRRNKPTETTK